MAGYTSPSGNSSTAVSLHKDQDIEQIIRDLEQSLSLPGQAPAPAPNPYRTSFPTAALGSFVQQDGVGESGHWARVIGVKALPLFTSIDKASKISQGDFLEMKWLAPKRPQPQESGQLKSEPRLSLTAWTRAYLHLVSQLAHSGSVDVQDIWVHMDIVLALAEDRHTWESVDFEF